jgi:hypothetical protein
MDSFQGGDGASKWTATTPYVRSTSNPRVTGGAGATSGVARKSFTAVSEVFASYAMYHAGGANGVTLTLRGDANATTHLTICRNSSGFLEVRRGTTSGTVLATGATVIPDSTWTHVQVRATVADSGGIVQARLNGLGSNEIDFTGDTKNAGMNSTIDNAEWNSTSSSNIYTDAVLLDTAADATGGNNTWTGDVRVIPLTVTGDGNSSQFVGSDGNSTNNFQLVDELPFSSTDYVGASTSGNTDTYALADLPAGVTDIRAVQICGSIAKSDAGSVTPQLVMRSGGTDYAGSSLVPSTTYRTELMFRETDPATSAAWTASGVNALQIGVKVT